MTNYILVDGKPTEEPDIIKWGKWFQDADRHVAQDDDEKYKISTIFLGINHNFGEEGPPLLFETMVFKRGSWSEEDCARYATQEEAEAGHAAMVAKWLQTGGKE